MSEFTLVACGVGMMTNECPIHRNRAARPHSDAEIITVKRSS